MTAHHPILVTGAHRSGTTWAGKMLCAGNEAFYVFEPFDVAKDAGLEGPPLDAPRSPIHVLSHPRKQLLGIRARPARRTVELHALSLLPNLARIRTPRHCGRLCKDWLFSHHARLTGETAPAQRPHRPVQRRMARPNLRHEGRGHDPPPRRVRLQHQTPQLALQFPENFIGQEALMDGLLAPYKDQIFEYARHPRDIIDQAILVWNAMYSAVRRYRETHPDWHFVTHERLSADPLAEFKPVYDYCGLTWNASAETVIAAHTRGGNPRDVSPENYRAIKRDSQAAAGNLETTPRGKRSRTRPRRHPARSRPISTARRSSMPAEPATLRRSITCSSAIFVLLLAPGCGVDRDTLATPTRYNDPAIVPEEIALFFNQDFEAVEAGRPAEWVARKDREDKVSVVQDGAYSGKSALCIDQGPEWYFVSQAASIDPGLVAGKVLTVTAMVKTEGAQLAHCESVPGRHTSSLPAGLKQRTLEQGRSLVHGTGVVARSQSPLSLNTEAPPPGRSCLTMCTYM